MADLASRIRLEDRECPLSTTVRHVGEWWTLLILHDAFDGYTRFDQFQDNLGISSSMLTTRLKTLVADGLLERRPYQDRPASPRVRAHRTRPLPAPGHRRPGRMGQRPPRPVAAQHDPCGREHGEEVEPVLVDAVTGHRLDDGDAYSFTAGPAASDAMRARYANNPGRSADDGVAA